MLLVTGLLFPGNSAERVTDILCSPENERMIGAFEVERRAFHFFPLSLRGNQAGKLLACLLRPFRTIGIRALLGVPFQRLAFVMRELELRHVYLVQGKARPVGADRG